MKEDKLYINYIDAMSQEMERYTGRLHRNLFGVLKFISEGDRLLTRAFDTIIDKIEANILQIAKKWN